MTEITASRPAKVQEPQRRPNLRTRLRLRAPSRVGIALSLTLIAVVDLVNIGGNPRFWDDEGTYYSQAWAVNHFEALAPYHYFYDHPPVGWVQLGLFTWLPGLLMPHSPSLTSGRLIMVGYAVVTAWLIYALARRLDMDRGFALAAMLLWGLSPLTVEESRQIFLDNIMLPWLLGAFVLATSRSRNIWHHSLAGLLFGIACLSKETILVVFPALLYIVLRSAYRPTRAFSGLGLCLSAGICGAAYILYAALRNELIPGARHVSLIGSLEYQLGGRSGSGFILASGSGAHGVLLQWLSWDNLLIYGGLLAMFGACFLWRLRPLGFALALLTVMALRPNGYLPGMYVIAVLPFCALLIAGLASEVHEYARKRDTNRTARPRAWMAVAGAFGLSLTLVAVLWVPRLGKLWSVHDNDHHQQVVAWTAAHIPHHALVVTDNTYWNDLARAGWSSDGFDGVVWYNKVDSDPEFLSKHPDGARSIRYVLWDSTMADDPTGIPMVRGAKNHSRIIATFGTGANALEIRQVIYP